MKHWDFPLFISLLPLSYISSFFSRSCTNKPFTRGPAMNLGPLDRTFLQSCIQPHSSLTYSLCTIPELLRNCSFEICKNLGDKIGMCSKSRVRMSASASQNASATQKTCELQAYVPRYVRTCTCTLPECRYMANDSYST
jgi:hypothetical protein